LKLEEDEEDEEEQNCIEKIRKHEMRRSVKKGKDN